MMKATIAALLILAALAAQPVASQSTGTLVTPCGTPAPPHTTWIVGEPWGPPSCIPEMGTNNSNVRWNLAGAVAWGSCRTADGKTHKWRAAVTRQQMLTTNVIREVTDALTAPPELALAQLRAIQSMYSSLGWHDPAMAAVWCSEEVALAAFFAPPPPPPPPPPPATWVVAPNGSNPERGTYLVKPVTGGGYVLSNTASDKARVLDAAGKPTPCDPAIQTTVGTAVYMSVIPAKPLVVTLCRKV